MKPPLTPDLKERFFAMHHKQKIVMDSEWEELGLPPYMCYPDLAMTKKNGAVPYLLLRPISALTDNEAIEVAKIPMELNMLATVGKDIYGNILVNFGDKDRRITIYGDASGFAADAYYKGDGWIDQTEFIGHEEVLHMYDYLRSISIALPFMGHSVEELCATGWVKLIENKTSKP